MAMFQHPLFLTYHSRAQVASLRGRFDIIIWNDLEL